ncbi:glycosyltransferase [Paenimyroides aestuarii]|uniref:Glycosyltransferase n=1 Tax=Paenimyroides aestuarii TaxID=2968490 RepID=A0ABY5NPZ9_9FLAO|nr:glycosyltransferase [Paenimyroides aestuarii]UUV20635.1 glycosyltransferase [Paenimyroides aestuarii]
MNILNVTSIVEWRGGDAQMYTIYNLLKKHKALNQYILCPINSVLYEKAVHDDAQVLSYIKKNKVFSLINPIIDAVKKHDIDVLHIHDSSALSAAIIAKICLKKEVKLIYSRKRNNRIKKNFFKKLKYDNKYIYKIVSVSKAVEQIFHDIHISSEKLLTIYDAINVAAFSNKNKVGLIHKELNLSQDIQIIGNISSLSKQKDLVTFINTAEKVIKKNQNVHFVILGSGSEEQLLKELVHTKKIENYVFFLGFKPNVADYLNEFDVLLMTSVTEGLPLTIYEAFASQIPIVSTKAGGIPEVITDGENGFLTEIGDDKTLAEKCLLLLNNSNLANNFKEKSFTLVKNNFDLKNLEENYYNFYTTL